MYSKHMAAVCVRYDQVINYNKDNQAHTKIVDYIAQELKQVQMAMRFHSLGNNVTCDWT